MSAPKLNGRMPGKRVSLIAVSFLMAIVVLAHAAAQWKSPAEFRLWHTAEPQPPAQNESEFVLARIQYTPRQELPYIESRIHDTRHAAGSHAVASWAHTYPQAEEHLLQIASEATGVNLSRESHVLVRLDSEELFQYPFTYLTEPGEMNLTGREAANLREYLNRGGFVMVDDFNTDVALNWFTNQMQKVFPSRRIAELDSDHPIFHAFYDTPTATAKPPYDHAGGGAPRFYGYFDDNGRLCMIVNHDNNLGAFWVWLDQPQHPLRASIQGARFGVNYFLYSLTH